MQPTIVSMSAMGIHRPIMFLPISKQLLRWNFLVAKSSED